MPQADLEDDLTPDVGEEKEPTAETEDGGEDETYLVSKDVFGPDVKPGDRETIEAVEVYEDDVEVKCLRDGGDKKPAESAADSMRSRTQARMAPMMSGGGAGGY